MATAETNAATISEVAQAGAVGQDITQISYWNTAGTGRPPTGGTYLAGKALTNNPAAIALGESLELAAGEVSFTQTAGTDEAEAMAIRRVSGAVSGGVWVQYHTGARGNGGTNNVASVARKAVAQSAFDIS